MQFTSVKKTSKCKKIIAGLIILLVLLGVCYGTWQYYSAFGLTMPSIDKVKDVSLKAEDSLIHQHSLTKFLKALRERVMTKSDLTAGADVGSSAEPSSEKATEQVSEQKSAAAKEPISKTKAASHALTNNSALAGETMPGYKIAYAKIKITIEKERPAYEMEKPIAKPLIKKPAVDSKQKQQIPAAPAKHEVLPAQPADYSTSKQLPVDAPVPASAPTSKQGQDLRALLQKVQRSSENQQVQRMQTTAMQNTAAKTNFPANTNTVSNNNAHLGVNNYPAPSSTNTQEPIVMINTNDGNGGSD